MVSFQSDLIGIMLAFTGACIDAWLFVLCRKISNVFHPTVPVFYIFVLSCIFVPIAAQFTPETEAPHTPICFIEFYPYIITILVLFYIHVILFSVSWKYITVGSSAILIYLTIPVTYVMDWIIFNRARGLIEIGGVVVIFATNITIVSARIMQIIS